MLLRDRLRARLTDMATPPDYPRLAAEVLGIRNAPPALARRLVEQALVLEDRRDAWLDAGARIAAAAPTGPGVYVLRDAQGRALYVGKANNLRRRLRTHFAARRWRAVKAELARVAGADWEEVGSEIEALLREAALIRDLRPVVNVQVGDPSTEGRAVPPPLVRDTLLVLPSASEGFVVLLAVRASGDVRLAAARRDGTGLGATITRAWRFFHDQEDASAVSGGDTNRLAPLVFSWLAGRGATATRLDPHDAPTARELHRRVRALVRDAALFTERIVVLRSGFRSTSKRP